MLHGTPKGNDFWGAEMERDYATSFYDGSKEEQKFVLDIRKSKDSKVYCYYTYARYNIADNGDRQGGYFAISLRMDKLYENPIQLYQILDGVFYSKVIGGFLELKQDYFKYKFTSFSENQDCLKVIEKSIENSFENLLDAKKFVTFNPSLSQNGKVCKLNLVDFTESNVKKAFAQCSKIVVSPFYASINEVGAEDRINKLKEQFQKDIVAKDEEIEKLKEDAKTLNSSISSYKKVVEEKDEEIKKNKRNGDLEKLVLQIKEPIWKLSDYFDSKETASEMPKVRPQRHLLRYVNIILICFVLLLCVLILINSYHPKNIDTVPNEINIRCDSLKRIIESDKTKIAQLEEQLASLHPDVPDNPIPKKSLRIDVANYNGGNLEVGKKYVVSIKEGNNVFNESGSWSISGDICEIEGDLHNNTITIKPIAQGNIEINYVTSNATVSPRTFSVVSRQTTQKVSISGPKQNDTLIIGQCYEFSVSTNNKGKWRVDGFEYKEGKPEDNLILVSPQKEIGVISFQPDNGTKVSLKYNCKK